ncbi:DUF2249 domain-containing protein [Bacillus suaedaesalsae]|uniref:DUF2249 domain-containing protein n=1 Tax=Bacillus suaedaesalsae TaxID=2810349 RepID=A0ABS2DEX3_9BACI|nr:DUF2249 domain-containing protein [Bacillus suaedaesalsae]MBM6617014.1 DUF2249 domain-containing protein [Bacillus suaedaesalsae]
MSQHTVELDVRMDQIDFKDIMKAVQSLKENEVLSLHSSFNPVPLYSIMKSKGFEYDSMQVAANHWKVMFYRKKKENHLNLLELDAPMIILKILNALEQLRRGDQITITVDHLPDLVQKQLEESSLYYYYQIQSPGNHMILQVTKVS